MRRLLGLVLLVAFGAVLQLDAQPPKADPKADPKTKTDPKAKVDPKAKAAPAFKGKVSAVDVGEPLLNAKVTKDDLKNRVVLLDYWGVNCPPCLAQMPKTSALYNELSEFGLVVLGSHVQAAGADKIKQVAKSNGATFPIVNEARYQGNDGPMLIPLPYCFLFDHTGTGMFEGNPRDADQLIRAAIGKMIVANAGLEKPSANLQPIVKDLLAGKTPMPLVSRVYALSTATGDTGKEAKALYDALTAVPQKKLADADGKRDSDPVAAFAMVENLATTWKGTPIATKANEMVVKLKREKAVIGELNARTLLADVKKLEGPLQGVNTSLPDFQKKFAMQLKPLKAKILSMKTQYPDAPSTKQALEIGSKYMLDVD